jgi:hypothetical protein
MTRIVPHSKRGRMLRATTSGLSHPKHRPDAWAASFQQPRLGGAGSGRPRQQLGYLAWSRFATSCLKNPFVK